MNHPAHHATRHATRHETRHVILIGAARSGTKVLRDALASATGAGSVPYDIGYVWRFGNEHSHDDLLSPAAVGERARRFIRGFVDRYADGSPPAVIEKTVGNALRVPAVAATFPDATFVHLVRDGVDVVESTRRQWTAPTDLRYLAGKVRHFPLRLAPRYGGKYLRSMAGRRASADGRVGSWGPRYRGIDADLRERGLLTVCARQWREAVDRAREDLDRLALPVVEVRYERLVTDPVAELARLAEFTGLPADPERVRAAGARITRGRQGTGRQCLTGAELSALESEVGDLLATLGYGRPAPAEKDELP